jgi:hypothetical protein
MEAKANHPEFTGSPCGARTGSGARKQIEHALGRVKRYLGVEPESYAVERMTGQAAREKPGASRTVEPEESVAHRREHQQPGECVGAKTIGKCDADKPRRQSEPGGDP